MSNLDKRNSHDKSTTVDLQSKRLFGVLMNPKSKNYISISAIKGIGYPLAKKICNSLSIDPEKKGLSDQDVSSIRNYIESNNIKIGGDLNSQEISNINTLIAIGCYRGRRHKLGYPVRGQRTKNNAKTSKKRRLFK
jgi:small subunit ribosomal protein S13